MKHCLVLRKIGKIGGLISRPSSPNPVKTEIVHLLYFTSVFFVFVIKVFYTMFSLPVIE